jgi:uncharacterized protein
MEKKTVLIAGGSGFLGRACTSYFTAQGWNVEWLSRNPSPHDKVKTWSWAPELCQMNPQAFESADVVLNLAGLSLSDGRWNQKRKQAFIESRISAVQTLSKNKPKEKDVYFISASATGYYGSYPEKLETTETSGPGRDFLAKLCVKWEAAANESSFSRIAVARIGVVLHPNEGAYPVMVKPLRMGGGAIPGTGRQGISWIDHRDFVRGIEWMMDHELEGVFNLTAPSPVSMRRFMETASMKYHRPLWPIHIGEGFLRLILGEKSVLASQGVYAYPEALSRSGFMFLYSSIEEVGRDEV